MRQTHTFVLKILLDPSTDSGQAMHSAHLRGQISEPSSDDEWRASFADVNELLQQLLQRVAAAPGEMEIGLALKRVEPNGKDERSHK